MQEGAKVPPSCIQLVVENFDNVCRQRRGGKEVVLLCCEANCSSTTDSPAVSGGGGVAVGRSVEAPESGNTESGGWWRVGRRERKGMKMACILVTFHSHTLDIPSGGG